MEFKFFPRDFAGGRIPAVGKTGRTVLGLARVTQLGHGFCMAVLV